LRLSGKGEGRLMELLKVLLALGARDVPQEQLAGALWPHVDGDYAQRSFNTTVYRLRKLLDVPDAILVREGRVSLNPACCWVDTWALETLLETIDAAFWEGAPPQAATAVPDFAQALQRLHRGAFLAGDDQRPVFKARRAHLRRRVQRGLLRLAGHWETHGEPGRAVDLLQHALDVDPLAESVCRELMLLLERLDRPSEALEVYTVCTATREAAGEAEDASTRDIAERLRAAGRR
jgi:DNA-binding SARP family transcriptional activator